MTAASEQTERDVLGFWVFLMSDAVIFALLFATYGTQLKSTAAAPTPAALFNINGVLLETLILLASSLTYGLASVEMKYQSDKQASNRFLSWTAATLMLGVAFLGLELHDFSTMFAAGAYPSRSGFLSAFFALVPFHAIHVLAGCVWLIVMMIHTRVLGCDAGVKLNVQRLGLFWHFLDIVWIAIFSVVYLQGIIR